MYCNTYLIGRGLGWNEIMHARVSGPSRLSFLPHILELYIKTDVHSKIKTQKTQFLIWERALNKGSPKKIHNWEVSIWDDQQYLSLGKWKLKQQWDISVHLLK